MGRDNSIIADGHRVIAYITIIRLGAINSRIICIGTHCCITADYHCVIAGAAFLYSIRISISAYNRHIRCLRLRTCSNSSFVADGHRVIVCGGSAISTLNIHITSANHCIIADGYRVLVCAALRRITAYNIRIIITANHCIIADGYRVFICVDRSLWTRTAITAGIAAVNNRITAANNYSIADGYRVLVRAAGIRLTAINTHIRGICSNNSTFADRYRIIVCSCSTVGIGIIIVISIYYCAAAAINGHIRCIRSDSSFTAEGYFVLFCCCVWILRKTAKNVQSACT